MAKSRFHSAHFGPSRGRWLWRSPFCPFGWPWVSLSFCVHSHHTFRHKPTGSLRSKCFELTPCLTTQLGDRLTPWIEPGSNSAAPGGAGCATGAGRAGRRAGGMITSGPHRLGRSRPTPSPDWSTAMRDGHGDARRAVSLRPLACRPRGALPRYGSQLRRAPGWGPLHRLALCHTFQNCSPSRNRVLWRPLGPRLLHSHPGPWLGALASIGLDSSF